MNWALRSEVGRRANNEDAVFATPRLLVVADGVGGAAAGEVASRMVVQEMMSLDKRRIARPLEEELRDAAVKANQTLRFLISYQPDHAGMASTLATVALSNDGEYLIANVGDSRTYLFREGMLRQLTRDESLVQKLIDTGAISEGEARSHPQRSVVLQALDGSDDRMPTMTRCTAAVGDRLLLCSDGLSDVLPSTQICRLLSKQSRDHAVSALVDAALSAGGKDNISVVVADVVWSDNPDSGWLPILPAPDHAN